MSQALVPTRDADTKKPAKRFTNCEVSVVARTIGTQLLFKMPVVNLSATGMLLTLEDGHRAPFMVNTILELDVKSADAPHLKTVQCLAKVIHTATQEAGDKRFGVKIIQADDEEKSQWNSMIQVFEERDTAV